MKKNLAFLLIVILLACATPSAYAGFVMKKQQTAVEVVANPEPVAAPVTIDERDRGHHHHEEEHFHSGRRCVPSRSGWEGLTGFICAMAGVGFLGVIFGAIGMRKGHRKRVFGIIGFIVGLVQTMIIAIALTIAIIVAA